MPSFRLELEVLEVRPGVAPPQVMRAAIDHLAAEHHIDRTDLDVVAGTARLLIRFVVPETNDHEEEAVAWASADACRKAVDEVAVPGRLWVLRRRKGAWVPLGRGSPPTIRPPADDDEP